MGGFFQGLGNVVKKGFELTNTGQRMKDADRRRLDEDNEFVDLVQQKGGKFALNGMVQDEGGVVRRADASRLIKHKTADGKTVMFELPTPEEQMRSHAKRLQEQFEMEAPTRAGIAAENVTNVGNEATARANATNTSNAAAEDANRERNGLSLAPLEDIFPGISGGGNMPRPAAGAAMSESSDPGTFTKREPRKALPTEFDDLVRAGANVENIRSTVRQRDAKPTVTVTGHDKETDDQGNVTAIEYMSDGSVKKESLGKIGKKTQPRAAGAGGGLTPYQALQEKNRAAKEAAAAISKRQTDLNDIQGKQDAIVADTAKFSREYEELQTQIADGALDSDSGAQKASALRRSSELKSIIAGNKMKHSALERQKATIEKVIGITKTPEEAAYQATAGAQGAAASAQAVQVGTVIANAKGEKQRYDGTQWVPITQ